jgi:hypothetical protein
MTGILFAYFGPESMLPLTSVVATAVGVFLMFGRNSIRLVRRAIRNRLTETRGTSPLPRPHFPIQAETRSPSETTRS